MPLNGAAIRNLAVTAQSFLTFAQLHSTLAGANGTDNPVALGRQPVNWAPPDSDGNFGLISAIQFTGGTPGADVYSVTLWDAELDGTFYGEFILDGDPAFSASGIYSITAIDVTGTST